MGVFDQISAALLGKPGVSGKSTSDSRPFDANPNIAKLRALGLTAMPDGGQEELDRLWAQKRVGDMASMVKKK